MSKRPFDILRASFILIAFVVVIVVLIMFISSMACLWSVVSKLVEPGDACRSLAVMFKEWWIELFATVFALIAAGGTYPKPPDDEEPKQ